MPSHQERREPLPKGYQFGDAGRPHKLEAIPVGRSGIAIRFIKQYDITADVSPKRMNLYGPWIDPGESTLER